MDHQQTQPHSPYDRSSGVRCQACNASGYTRDASELPLCIKMVAKRWSYLATQTVTSSACDGQDHAARSADGNREFRGNLLFISSSVPDAQRRFLISRSNAHALSIMAEIRRPSTMMLDSCPLSVRASKRTQIPKPYKGGFLIVMRLSIITRARGLIRRWQLCCYEE